ncbi:hypothetical protein KZO01_23680 [Kurthia zopfii]|nr:hypothetical protein KZO01_23680 [Kurthia zopfii]
MGEKRIRDLKKEKLKAPFIPQVFGKLELKASFQLSTERLKRPRGMELEARQRR